MALEVRVKIYDLTLGAGASDCYDFGSGYLTPGACWVKGAVNKSRRPEAESDGKCPSGSANWDAYNP